MRNLGSRHSEEERVARFLASRKEGEHLMIFEKEGTTVLVKGPSYLPPGHMAAKWEKAFG